MIQLDSTLNSAVGAAGGGERWEGMEMYNFKIDIIVKPDEDEFHAYCPALKGLHVCGDTEEEAVENAVGAAEAYLVSLVKHGDPIPIGVLTEKGTGVVKTPVRRSGQSHQHTKNLVLAGT